MPLEFSTSYLSDSISLFRYYKKLGDGALAQVADDQLFYAQDEECNSIAIIMRHIAGNMLSRWTDFLTSDGEKPTRNRDSEFEEPPRDRQQLSRDWDEGWACLLNTLESLTDSDLTKRVLIRGEAHSVMQALNRQVTHCAMHVGQIVLLAKHLSAAHWKPLTVPRNQSAEFNRRVAGQ